MISPLRQHLRKFVRELDRVTTYLKNEPTINYGSVLAMRCVGVNVDSYTMSMPLTVLKTLAAD